MKTIKNKLFLATAILALASCADNTYLGDQEANKAGGPISFGFEMPSATRGTADDASKLGNSFIIYGEKGETSKDKYSDGNLVFPNYTVAYTASSANTTTSNTKNWEYVGITPISTSYVKMSDGTNTETATSPQTIKYWDNTPNTYTFTAVSAKKEDIENGRVIIQKNTKGSSNKYEKGYTLTLAKTSGSPDVYPDMSKIFFSDRNEVAKANYGNVVTMNFRNALTQVRAGIYETVPGYNVSSIKFYVNTTGNSPTQTEEAKVNSTSAFGAVCNNTTTDNFEGTITVTYYSDGADINKPILSVSPNTGAQKTNLILGTNLSSISTSSLLSETASAPSWDKANGDYTAVLPQTTGNPLKLKCDYTLYNPTTKETINITGKTAEIPAQYLQWKANYKYSYIFKITDDDLNPITFDAVVVTDAMGNAEYITTVTQPSITTFGVIVNSSDEFKNYVTEKNEYQIPSGTDKLDIYATFVQDATVLQPQLTSSDKANYVTVYFVDYKTGATDAEKAEKPITELSVANAIEHTGGLITATAIQSVNNIYFANDADDVPKPVTSVPAEDGTTKTINAVKLPGVITAGKYAVEIVTYEAVTLSAGAELNGYYSVNGNGEYTKQTSGTYSSGTYYRQVKTYKVITVVTAP